MSAETHFLYYRRVLACAAKLNNPIPGIKQYDEYRPLTGMEWRSSRASVEFAAELEAILDEFMVKSSVSACQVEADGKYQLSVGNTGEVEASRRQTVRIDPIRSSRR